MVDLSGAGDDFVCSSSPAVEQAVRSLAQDIQQPKRWSRQLFVEDVQYKVLLIVQFVGLELLREGTRPCDRE